MSDTIWPARATKTASALITTGAGVFGGVAMATDGTNAVTLTVYDGTDATGEKILPTMTIPTSSTDRMQGINIPARYYTGIYVSITCAGTCEYTVYYKSE